MHMHDNIEAYTKTLSKLTVSRRSMRFSSVVNCKHKQVFALPIHWLTYILTGKNPRFCSRQYDFISSSSDWAYPMKGMLP